MYMCITLCQTDIDSIVTINFNGKRGSLSLENNLLKFLIDTTYKTHYSLANSYNSNSYKSDRNFTRITIT